VSSTLRIGAYYGTSVTSRITQIRTWSPVSHVSLIFDDPGAEVIEAVRAGVVSQPTIHGHHKPGTRVAIYRVDATRDQVVRIHDFARGQVGKAYDWAGLFGFIARRNLQNPDKWFCSELVFAACEAGAVLLLRGIPAYKVAPCDILYSPHLSYETTLFTGCPPNPAEGLRCPTFHWRGTPAAGGASGKDAACFCANAAWSGGAVPGSCPGKAGFPARRMA